MKLCLVHPMDPLGNKVGGAETFARELLQLAPNQVNRSLIGVRSPGSSWQTGRWQEGSLNGAHLDFLPLITDDPAAVWNSIPLSLRFTLALARRRLDWSNRLVFFNRIEPAMVRTPGALARVAVIHNDVQAQIDRGRSEVAWRHFPWLYHQLEARLFRRFDQVFTVHQSTLKYYRRRYPELQERFSFLPTWVDSRKYRPADLPVSELRRRLAEHFPGLRAGGRWILFSGRLEPQKNPLDLITAFRAMLPRHPDLHLLLAGEGSLFSAVRQAAGCDAPRIHLFGALSPAILLTCYQAADLLVLASLYEGMPLAVLEALACGLPVVAPPVGEIPRLIRPGENGELAVDSSPEAVAAALEKALGRVRAYDRRNCRRSVEPFTSEVVIPMLFSRLQGLAARLDGV